jgi:hypothetical protein
MLRTRADRLRMGLFTSLGLVPLACGARVEPPEVAERDGTLSTSPSQNDSSSDPPALPTEACDGFPLITDGVDTGLVNCSNGVVHRPVAVECANRLGERVTSERVTNESAELCNADPSCTPPMGCRSDADCTADAYGHCEQRGQLPQPVCVYGCVTDADCNAEEACVCGSFIGECISATCRSAEDCGGEYLCAQFRDLFGIGCGEPIQLACQTPADECRAPRDCAGGGNCSAADGPWRCVEVPGIACGRPFLVDGQARLASVVAARHEGVRLGASLHGLDATARERLARAWLEVGRMEHASIAAFARFCLQLLELGAPHELLVAAQAAMADETEHTKLAFALASHYAGTPLGPGALPMDGALRASQLDEILLLVLREGCVGETVAALEAIEALAHAEDPVVRQVLERIARDERAHAELAWRFVAWALRERPELSSLVERELCGSGAPRGLAAEAPTERGACLTDPVDLLRHGILSDAERAAVHAAAWRDVVQPCARHILAALRPSPTLNATIDFS